MASQYVEQIGVGMVGKLFGRGLIGGLLGSAAGQAVSSGFSFATTHALGRLAVRYYAGGRTFSTQVLKDTYDRLFGEAKRLQGQYRPAIREGAHGQRLPDAAGSAGVEPPAFSPRCAWMGPLTGPIRNPRAFPIHPRPWPSGQWQEPSQPLGDERKIAKSLARLTGVEQSSVGFVPTEYAYRLSP